MTNHCRTTSHHSSRAFTLPEHPLDRLGTVRKSKRWAFTLTELLVVIGIIVALAAIGLPMALRSYKYASKTRTQADLQAISTALNAYRQDFGDYPRIGEKDSSGMGCNVGAAILGKALIGPYGDGLTNPPPPQPRQIDQNDPPAKSTLTEIKSGQCVSDGGGYVALVDNPATDPPDPTEWAFFFANDGLDGPGFRARRLPGPDRILFTGDDVFQGQTKHGYLQAEKFNLAGTMLHDRDGLPILYFPARHGASNIRNLLPGPIGGYVSDSSQSMYDARDGMLFFRRPATESDDTNSFRAIRAMLGDMDGDGRINGSETPATEAPFLLWTAGPDALFGPVRTNVSGTWTPTKREIDKCDDITNFLQ